MSQCLTEPCPGGSTDLERLLAAARRGDAEAWTALYARFAQLIINTSLRLGLSEAESEDVAQTTWLRLLENVHRLRVDAALPGWLVTTSRREAWALVRRRNREIPTPDQVDMAAGRFDDDVEEAIDHGRRLEAVRRATSALPERERSLVELLLHQDGHSYAQICERVGMPVGAIGPVRQRAVARLRTLLDVDVA